MIDLILFLFTMAMFSAGFYCGGKFGTAAAMFRAARTKVAGWFGDSK
jgi:hypothetical protein